MTTDPPSTLESRTAKFAIFGKCIKDYKTKVSFDASLAIEKKCHALGITPSEWLRDLAYKELYGKDVMVSMYAERLDGVPPTGTERGQE